jgi:hypothetical protein
VRYGKWAGLFGGSIGWFAHQQVSSSWVFARCPENSLTMVLAVAAVCTAIALVSGLWSWSVWGSLQPDPGPDPSASTDRFVAAVSAAIALISLLYILFSTLAPVFLQCQR